MNDKKARSYAKHLDLSLTGTLGLLLAAHKAGIFEDIDTLITELKRHNFHIPPDIEDYLP